MTRAASVLVLLAAASSLGLAGVALARPRRARREWSFGVGMLGFALEAVAAWALLTQTESPEDRLLWLRAVQVTGLLLLVPWTAFTATLLSPRTGRRALDWCLGAAAVLALAGSVAVVGLQVFELPDLPGPFYAARLAGIGRYGIILQLLLTAGILAGLEAALRASRRETRWRIKYLILGLGGIFLLRFYLLSHVLLFHVVMASYLAVGATALFIGNLVMGISLARDRLQGAELAISRELLFRSVVLGVLGVYLLAVGALGSLLNHLGIPEEMFWGSLVVFVSALGLAALCFSEDVRWRLRRFLGRHFYRSKYDYREQWSRFTKRLGSLLTAEELAPELLGAVTEAVGATRGVLYLTGERNGRYHLAGTVGISGVPSTLSPEAPLVVRLRTQRKPHLAAKDEGGRLTDDLGLAPADSFLEVAVAVPLHWREALTGLMLLGPERTGAPYRAEDLEFLETVGEQAAGAVVIARLSESLARSREFEAFHRVTSFVIHDLKNAVSALSMLSQNALAHFDQPEFQRDAMKTLSRTAERIRRLLGRLTAAGEIAELQFEEVDLATLLGEAATPLLAGRRVRLVQELEPVPSVLGDPEALERVLQNLLTNALEAMDGDGELALRAGCRDGLVVCTVADTGCGMSAEFMRRSLFVPFRSTKKGGWGIGLYQAKEIVEAHGGRIEVRSEEGRGTAITLLLPPATVARGARHAAPA